MVRRFAGIDIHKRVLMVVVLEGLDGGGKPLRGRFGTTTAELAQLSAWLLDHNVFHVVMESTAQYWRPVWLALEGHFRLALAQAWSNRAPRGKKADYKDAERLVRRYLANELTLSFVPDPEQREMRIVMRRRTQLTRDRVRIQNQTESLLEETRIKLSSVVSDLFGATGIRILEALVQGETDPQKLAELADARIQCKPKDLVDALTGVVTEVHRGILKQHLDDLKLVDAQIEDLAKLAGEAMKKHSDAITRLAQVPGIGVIAGQQIVAEAGPTASAFDSAAQFSSWIGTCPGRNESAEENHSSRCPKGNMYLRRTLCQAAQAAVRTKNSFFEQKFNRLKVKLGYSKAIWAIARHLSVVIWKILHQGVDYIEYGGLTNPKALQRHIQRLKKQLRQLGYSDELKPVQVKAVGV